MEMVRHYNKCIQLEFIFLTEPIKYIDENLSVFGTSEYRYLVFG